MEIRKIEIDFALAVDLTDDEQRSPIQVSAGRRGNEMELTKANQESIDGAKGAEGDLLTALKAALGLLHEVERLGDGGLVSDNPGVLLLARMAIATHELSGSWAAVSASPQLRDLKPLLKIVMYWGCSCDLLNNYGCGHEQVINAIEEFFAAAPAQTEPDYNRAYTIMAEALNLNPAFYGLVEMAQVAANRLTGKYDVAQEQASSPGPRPVCPKCGTARIARYMLSFGRLSCPECKAQFHVQCPDDFAQFFPASLNGEKQRQIDISNLRFYSAMAHDFRWQTDIIHYGVITQTLSEIADRLAGVAATTQGTPEGTE